MTARVPSPSRIRRAALTLGVVLLLVAVPAGPAQEPCPDPGTVLFPGVTGAALQESLRVAFRPPTRLGYGPARDFMFTVLDNEDGVVTGVYTGYAIPLDPESEDPRQDALALGINTEHTWPQSKGADSLPMRADLHHLFPSEMGANSDRGSLPFAEIPDEETDRWYRLRTVTSMPDPGVLDEYSERRSDGGQPRDWEPREDHKGNVARALAYFWTVYRNEVPSGDRDFFDDQKDDLRAWHLDDPVDDGEHDRTCAVAGVQEGKPNPFVIDPTLFGRAYFPQTPVRLAAFGAEPTADGIEVRWRAASETAHLGYHVARTGPGGERRLTAAPVRPGEPYRLVDATARPGVRYDYWLDALARDGAVQRFGPRSALRPGTTFRALPNPARAGSVVRFEGLPPGGSGVDVYDLRGRRVRSLAPAAAEAGWDGADARGRPLPSGIYFARPRGETGAAHRLVLLR